MLLTPRLILRPYLERDEADLAAILGDPETMKWWDEPLDRDDVRDWLRRSRQEQELGRLGRLAVRLATTGELIGDCGILPMELDDQQVYDIGWIILPRHQRQGYAKEAGCAVRDHAFEYLRIPALYAKMPVDHVASRRVAEAIGMHALRTYKDQKSGGRETVLYVVEKKK
jgi:ribosomal-protein-alanine N-acetyltransferase